LPADDTLSPTPFLDAEHPRVQSWAQEQGADADDPKARAVRLFRAARDRIRYTVRADFTDPEGYRASATLARGDGFCVPKSVLLAAAARAVGIPSRLHFADLRNRLIPDDLRTAMRTDLFAFHGYVELQLDGHWWGMTPSFDLPTCERHGIVPVVFDGHSDALLHPDDVNGRPQFEYVRDRGVRNDVPFEEILAEIVRTYPHYDPDAWGRAFGEDEDGR
jgi:transglutaminase-like putative cysteine protease